MAKGKKTQVVESVETVETVRELSQLETVREQIRKGGDRPTQGEGVAYLLALFATVATSVGGWKQVLVDLLADNGIVARCILAACGDVDTQGDFRLFPSDHEHWTKEVGQGQRRIVKKNVDTILAAILGLVWKTAPGLGIDLVYAFETFKSANGRHRTYAAYVASDRADVAASNQYTMPVILSMVDESESETDHADLFSAYDAGMKQRDGVDMVTIVSGTIEGASVKAQAAMILHSRLEGIGGTYSASCTPSVVASYVNEYSPIGYAADFLISLDESLTQRNKGDGNVPKKIGQVVPPSYVAGIDSLCQMIDTRNVDESAYDFLTFKGPTVLPDGWCERPKANSTQGAIVDPPLSVADWSKVDWTKESKPTKSEAEFVDVESWGPLTVRFRTFLLRLVEAYADRDNADHSPILRDLAKRLAKGGNAYVTGRDGMLADVTQAFLAWCGLWTMPDKGGLSLAFNLPDLSSGDYRTHLGKIDSKLRDKARHNASERAKKGSMPRLGGFDLRAVDR